jgi:hypothetical protein
METETGSAQSLIWAELLMVPITKLLIMLLQSRGLPSTFKLVDLMAILEDKAADTSTVYDTIWWCIHGGDL